MQLSEKQIELIIEALIDLRGECSANFKQMDVQYEELLKELDTKREITVETIDFTQYTLEQLQGLKKRLLEAMKSKREVNQTLNINDVTILFFFMLNGNTEASRAFSLIDWFKIADQSQDIQHETFLEFITDLRKILNKYMTPSNASILPFNRFITDYCSKLNQKFPHLIEIDKRKFYWLNLTEFNKYAAIMKQSFDSFAVQLNGDMREIFKIWIRNLGKMTFYGYKYTYSPITMAHCLGLLGMKITMNEGIK